MEVGSDWWQAHVVVGWLGYACLASIFLYIAFLSFGPGSVCWYITAELVPQDARSLALGTAQLVNNLFSLALGFVLLPAFQAIQSYAFIPFFIVPSGTILALFLAILRGHLLRSGVSGVSVADDAGDKES